MDFGAGVLRAVPQLDVPTEALLNPVTQGAGRLCKTRREASPAAVPTAPDRKWGKRLRGSSWAPESRGHRRGFAAQRGGVWHRSD